MAGDSPTIARWNLVPIADVHHHALALNIGDLQPAQFRATDSSRVQGHQHRAVEEVTGRVDQLRDFLWAQDHRKPATPLGSRNVVEQIASLQRLYIEEPQRGHILLDRARLQLPLLEECAWY